MSYTGCCGLGNGLPLTTSSAYTISQVGKKLPPLPKQQLCYDPTGNIRVPCDYPGAITAEEARVPGYLYDAGAEADVGVEPPPSGAAEACWAQGGEWDYNTETCMVPPTGEPGSNYLLWAGIIGGSALVLGTGAYLVMRKKKGR